MLGWVFWFEFPCLQKSFCLLAVTNAGSEGLAMVPGGETFVVIVGDCSGGQEVAGIKVCVRDKWADRCGNGSVSRD